MKAPTKDELRAQIKLATQKADYLEQALQEAKGLTPNDFLYYTYSIEASVLEDNYTPNHIQWMDVMSRVDLTQEQLEDKGYAYFARAQQAALFFDEDRPHRSVVDRMRLCRLDVKRLGRRPWCLRWFAHSTYRDGRTDEEILHSFEQYVRQYSWMQDVGRENVEKRYGQTYVCLMGAEDRWRWSLCDCQDCKAGEFVVIKH